MTQGPLTINKYFKSGSISGVKRQAGSCIGRYIKNAFYSWYNIFNCAEAKIEVCLFLKRIEKKKSRDKTIGIVSSVP